MSTSPNAETVMMVKTRATDRLKFVNLGESTLTTAWPTRVTEPRNLARKIFRDYTC